MKFEHCNQCRNEVVWYAFVVNVFLTIYKAALGVMSGSGALVADAFHSGADVIASVVTMFSLKVSEKPADDEHPYGHGKVQYVSSGIVGLILAVGATGLLVTSISKIIAGNIEAPSRVALLGAIISMVFNEVMYRYQHCVGTENNSPAIIANAWDNRSDAISSAAVMVGLVFATFGYPIADALAAVGVSLVVIKIGVELCSEAIDGLMDASLEVDQLKEIYAIVTSVTYVKEISYLRARPVGESFQVDIEVVVDGSHKVYEGDVMVEVIRKAIRERVEGVDVVHVFLAPESAVETTKPQSRFMSWIMNSN